MHSVNATDLKNRLGPVLARAALEPVAVLRHGRVVAYLVPPDRPPGKRAKPGPHSPFSRGAEERLLALAASRDLRLSRWKRAGDPWLLAGLATMLASQPEFDRVRLLALAERLHPGMSTPEEFGRWLAKGPLRAARFLPMLRRELARA